MSIEKKRQEEKRKEKTTPFGFNLMRSQVLHQAAQILSGIKVVLARPIVPPITTSLQRIYRVDTMVFSTS